MKIILIYKTLFIAKNEMTDFRVEYDTTYS